MNSSIDLTEAVWVKSSYSANNGQCVEVARLSGARWAKSSYSEGNGQCVEVARLGETSVALRDSKHGEDGPVVLFGGAPWRAFLAAAGPLPGRRP
ncbi:DUF397 domain-containing protein [Streptomyces sp. DSM 44917]|uniref:DUF397 domain-containing protein n=1 Tax=Streptomyces boetiae TaxID=3075541 RepID=A0ABU2L1T1_9ACTN|nr:DUF397 domain-containing protein [Streptomyces sp. DSM 44917]MDT0305522.1 DUF397 domain-containing protein [Streptomyces sp. DSM 44917]